ncbi:MAG: glycoside hydrolase family 2 [Planctomycetes bacterium]|nr:glycoside hydrolase family 2 [Planctomycetota bacterium]
MKSNRFGCFVAFLTLVTVTVRADIPLPEHPRPDFMRAQWINLNGPWSFKFDPDDSGIRDRWHLDSARYDRSIVVPFPWGSPLSTVPDEADIAWYGRQVTVPEAWKGKRVFLVIGACDWLTTVWFAGEKLGEHQGGYTPFEFELTEHVTFGAKQTLVLRVDDHRAPEQLYGKQGYGAARGIWQTPYLEARGREPIDVIQFLPDIDSEEVTVKVKLLEAASRPLKLRLSISDGPSITETIPAGAKAIEFKTPIKDPRLWELDDPHLYHVTATIGNDEVKTYFGMREIGVVDLPGTDYPYVSLNGKPIYLQMALDQAYHPEGYYTFPSDAFVREEVLRSRSIGLNAMRVHVKIALPRKLYWADRLGMLIMADVPNSWGTPNAAMRKEIDIGLRGMIKRDFNHPSIFSWVLFNETWGLRTERKYLPETQEWVVSMVKLAKALDPTRLVEDNSPNREDHTVTDLNTWHAYLPGYQWMDHLKEVCDQTYPGSGWNFASGYQQNREPMLNSECGNVWGYTGSTGDIDWSWDYHRMINAFRMFPKCAGWLYTEHHDVVNEWNGYWRFDRSEKSTGMEALLPGMSLRDLHAPYYITLGDELCRTTTPGERIDIPLHASFFMGKVPSDSLDLSWELVGWDYLGEYSSISRGMLRVPCRPWMQEELEPLTLRMPEKESVAVLRVHLRDAAGTLLHRNFTTFHVVDESTSNDIETVTDTGTLRTVRFDAKHPSKAEWSLKQWDVMGGLKVNGAGAGYFEYRIPWPQGLTLESIQAASFRAELSAKRLLGKDKKDMAKQEGNFMLGKGTHDPGLNPNAYPMTDTERFPSAVRILISGETLGVVDLPDDPADHRGILSWHAQLKDRKLREAGSYGYLVSKTLTRDMLDKAKRQGEFVIRLEVDEALPGGLAIYGRGFGRYPLDPCLVFALREP